MGFDSKYLERIRKIGRKVVLPSDEIKGILESHINFSDIKSVLDFGAGSLFWSEYFARKISMGGDSMNQVFAIDSIYATYRPKCVSSNITLSVDIFSVLNSQQFDLIFMCDVLHHLNDEILERVLDAIKANGAKIIVIKDIDSRHRFGDFMNKTHDLLINNERVRSIFPNVLEDSLKSSGFNTEYFYLPKLWYPHFLLVGTLSKL